jgi:hypothetical protein
MDRLFASTKPEGSLPEVSRRSRHHVVVAARPRDADALLQQAPRLVVVALVQGDVREVVHRHTGQPAIADFVRSREAFAKRVTGSGVIAVERCLPAKQHQCTAYPPPRPRCLRQVEQLFGTADAMLVLESKAEQRGAEERPQLDRFGKTPA